MKYSVDLHIHSALSPCADNDMTPNNIVNMALIKGLDFIAVTDHNCAENYLAVSKCAESSNLVLVPGMEVETREEVHLVCLFLSADDLFAFQNTVYNALPNMENRPEIFGQQVLMDHEDRVLGYNHRFLITATALGIDEIFQYVYGKGGVVIPSHVDRDSYSIISNLGFVPEHLKIKYLEVSRDCDVSKLITRYHYLTNYHLLKSSDAHHLGNILEKETFIELGERSLNCLISALRGEI